MNNGLFSQAILNYTAQNSNFETTRNYISLSHVSSTVDEILNEYQKGFADSLEVRLKCYKGYQMEADLLKRIKAVYGSQVETGKEITAFAGKVKGHPDFYFNGYPGDCKSVLMDDWLPKDNKLPKRIYWQMQAYMKYGCKDQAIVIFESRETGKLIDIWIRENRAIQKEIEDKLNQVIKAIVW